MIGYLIQSPLEYFAKQTPHSSAMCCQGEHISYSELDLASNQFAAALRANGAIHGDRVGIYLHKCLSLGVALYGILKAGCVFVPLDPYAPVDRVEFILDDCGINHVVSSDALSDTLSKMNGSRILCVYGVEENLPFDQLTWNDVRKFPTSGFQCELVDQDLGYIMYTSGSTGTPKGMMHTHLSSITYARWGAMQFALTAADRVASHAPLHFDLSIFDFFSTAQSGGSVVLVPETVTKFPASWTKTIEDERISVVFTVPYTLITMLEQGAMEKRDLSSLRWILFGGEPFPPRQLKELMERLNHVKFTNVYGPAEAPSCTCFDISVADLHDDEALPIGVVSRNSTDLIIDEDDNDCPPGVSGELCIRSSTLTKGYWNRPDLNATAFLLREGYGPFPLVFFRTGDHVVRQPDGNLRFLGRADRMVKIRGNRVELDEVEAVLASHDSVQEAAAFALPEGHGSMAIYGAVTLDAKKPVDSAELLRLLRSKLSPYAVPRNLRICDELPHTTSGKIDRRVIAEKWKTKTLK